MDEETKAVAVRLQALATRILRLARSANAEHALTSAQYSALAVLHERGAVSLVELARAERVAHPTMSRIVAGLEKRGAVARPADPGDRRMRRVDLTPEGRALYEQVAANRIAVTAAILGQLRPETRAEVLAVVARVAEGIEKTLGRI